MKKTKIFVIVSLIVCLLAMVASAYFYIKQKQYATELDKLYRKEKQYAAELDILNDELEQSQLKLDSLNKVLKKITYEEITGNRTDNVPNDSIFYQMLLANNKIKKLDSLESGHLRKDIVIRYYTKKIDGNIVYNLSKLGYYVHKRQSVGPYKNYKSNIIHYGNSVDSTDLLLVTLSLIKSGLPIKKISPFPKSDWRNNSIQIEADIEMVDKRNLTVDEVVNYQRRQ